MNTKRRDGIKFKDGEVFMATNVSSFDELKTAIEDSATTEIIVENDLTFSGGATVNTSKGSLTIDFGGHKVEDMQSSSLSNTIHIPSNAPTFLLTLKNAEWSGRNFYGVVGVYDGNTNVSLVLDEINYKGPQFVYNKNGATKIVDCVCVLDKNETATDPQELGEVNRLTISGNVVVNSNATTNSVLWFSGASASLTVEADAYFEVNALSTYLFHTDSSPALAFGKNSKTFIITKSGLFFGAGRDSHIASSFLLDEGATFSATRNESNAVPMLKCVSNFTVKSGATLNLFSPKAGTSALLYFGQAANMTISSPNNVVFYNNSANIFSFEEGSVAAPNIIIFTSELMHLWDTATTPVESAGGIDDVPTSSLHKAGYSQEMTATIEADKTKILSIDSNLVEGDEGYPLSTSFALLSSKVISMGALPLTLSRIDDWRLEVSGVTAAYSNVRMNVLGATQNARALGNGAFSFTLSDALEIGTQVDIMSNKNFLTKTLTKTSEGSVRITKISPLEFHAFSTMPNRLSITRVDPDWSIEVTDTRESGGDWLLYAFVNAPLTSGANTLDDALVYVEQPSAVALSQTPILIHREAFSQDSKTTIKWQEMEGFLLALDPQKTYVAGDYSTQLFWEIRER